VEEATCVRRAAVSAVAPVAALILGLSALICAPSAAHDLGVRHRAIASVRAAPGGLAVDVLMMMEVRHSKRINRLMGRFDINRSGTLEEAEGRALAAALGAEAVGGFVLDFQGEAVAPTGVEGKASRTKEGGLMVALYMDYRMTGSDRGRVGLRVQAKRGARPLPVAVELQAEASLSLRAVGGPRSGDAQVVGPLEVRAGSAGVWIEVVPADEGPLK